MTAVCILLIQEMNHERLMKYVPELNATLSNDPNVQATTPFKWLYRCLFYETLTNVASICITCGSINRTLFLYKAGAFNCSGLPSK